MALEHAIVERIATIIVLLKRGRIRPSGEADAQFHYGLRPPREISHTAK